MTAARTTDRTGCTVTVGTRIRLLEIADSVLRDLPADEQQDLRSMVGEVFEVYEIDKHGAAWVEKCWPGADGACCSRSHSIGLDPHEMEVA
jgi:hypothetical protein